MNVIHRTTLQFLASVNEPDYPEPTWKWNPDMAATLGAGVPFKYWKAPADWNAVGAGPVVMTQLEKDAVDAALAAVAAASLENERTAMQPGLSKGDMAAVNDQGKIKALAVGADGEILIADSAQPLGVKWGRRLTPVTKPANTIRTATTVLASDPELTFPVVAGGAYIFRMQVGFDTTAAGDFKFSVSGPAGPVEVRIQRHAIAAGATAFSAVGVDTAFGVSVSVTGTGTTGGYVEINGKFLNGVNAGNVAFQWAQNTSDPGNTIVKGGSVLEWVRTN